MILETEDDLVYTYERIVRLHRLAEKMHGEMTDNDTLKADEIEGVYAMIRKMERQVAAYYAAHPERLKSPQQAA